MSTHPAPPPASPSPAALPAALAIARKDVRQLLRDRAGFFFSFIFPLLVAVFFGSIFSAGGGTQRIDIDLVDEDGSAGSREFVQQLIDGDDLGVNRLPDRAQAVERVRRGDVGAAVIVPKGFGEARAAPFSGQRMKLEVAIDPSRQAIGGMLSGILTKYGFMQLQSAFQRPQEMRRLAGESLDRIRKSADLDPARKALFERFFGNLDTMLATIPDAAQDEPEPQPTPDKPGDATPAKKSGGFNWQPLELVEVPVQIKRDFPTNGYSLTFPQGIMWGIMGCSLAFAISLVLERSRGTLMRLRVAPLPPWTILLGKSIACFVVTAGVACTLLAVGVLAFGVRPISYPLLLGAVVCASLCFVGLMNLLAAVSPSERAASGLGWGVMIVLAMVGGVMVPVEFLPEWLQRVGSLSPMRWSLLAMSAGIWRDLPMSRYALACAIQLGVGLVGFVAGVRAFGTAESRA